MKVEWNNRLKSLPPYLFIEIDRKKKEVEASGRKVIDFGIGDPDTPTPDFIVSAMREAVAEAAFHRYPLGRGRQFFREEVGRWFQGRYGVSLDPASEILALIGTKEGIGHLPFAFLDPGDIVLVPEPGYPVYANSTVLAGGEPFHMPLRKENGFLPDLESLSPAVLNRAKIMFLNYPNNPTGAVAPDAFWQDVIALADRYGIIVASDAAYAEVYYDNPPKSLLEFPGGREVGIEFHSLSKTFNMTGWRIGFACGNQSILSGLAEVKGNIDSGVFDAVQAAAKAAFGAPPDYYREMRLRYRGRMELLLKGLAGIGIEGCLPGGTFYFWAEIPTAEKSADFSARLLEEYGILTTPGNGFGPSGEGYARFSVTLPESDISEAVKRLSGAG